VSFACLLNSSVCVQNIRAGRSTPGLRPQHMTGILNKVTVKFPAVISLIGLVRFYSSSERILQVRYTNN